MKIVGIDTNGSAKSGIKGAKSRKKVFDNKIINNLRFGNKDKKIKKEGKKKDGNKDKEKRIVFEEKLKKRGEGVKKSVGFGRRSTLKIDRRIKSIITGIGGRKIEIIVTVGVGGGGEVREGIGIEGFGKRLGRIGNFIKKDMKGGIGNALTRGDNKRIGFDFISF